MRSFQAEASDLRAQLNRVTQERDALIEECARVSTVVMSINETNKDLYIYMKKYKRMDKFIAWRVANRMGVKDETE